MLPPRADAGRRRSFGDVIRNVEAISPVEALERMVPFCLELVDELVVFGRRVTLRVLS
jgi:hypothetical protein